MTVRGKSRQRGISFLGLIFVGAVVGISGVIAAQVFPTTVEYRRYPRPSTRRQGGESVPEVRIIFDKAAAIDAITSIAGKDLEVTKEGDKVVVRFAYQVKSTSLVLPG
jgi:hypothetical protein